MVSYFTFTEHLEFNHYSHARMVAHGNIVRAIAASCRKPKNRPIAETETGLHVKLSKVAAFIMLETLKECPHCHRNRLDRGALPRLPEIQ